MADIKEVALATWRLEKWIERINIDNKVAGKSIVRSLKRYLAESEIEVQDLTGDLFVEGMAVDIVNNEAEDSSDEPLIILDTVRPIIKQQGRVIEFGQVIIGNKPESDEAATSTVGNSTIEESAKKKSFFDKNTSAKKKKARKASKKKHHKK